MDLDRKKCALFIRAQLLVLFFAFSFDAFASGFQGVQERLQERVITGVVKDNNGEPLIGVNVVVKGHAGIGVITNADGEFTLKVPSNAEQLVASFIGYSDVVVSIGTKKSLVITMQEATQELGEVQVIAYGSQKKVTITGAISSINNKELLKTPVSSLGNAIAGKLPGVSTVQYSGTPGGDDPELYVRGVGTLNAGKSSPLILVDGVERSFFQIDPNEVESINVLKDASATAVFGVRGANGVVLVTTKRGEKGRAKVSVSTSVGVQIPTRLQKYTNSYQWVSFYNEAQRNDGIPEENLRFQPDVVQAFKDHSQPLIYPDMDWMNYIMKDATFQSQHNVNISGGTEKVRYFVSAGLLTQDGLLKQFNTGYDANFSYNRYNYRANLDFELTKTTSLSVNIGGRVEDKKNPVAKSTQEELFRLIYWCSPISGAGIVDGKWIKTNSDYIPGGEVDEDPLTAYYGRGYETVVKNVLNTDVSIDQNLSMITKGLSIKLKGAYNSTFTHNKNRTNKVPTYTPVLQSDGTIGLTKDGPDTELGYNESYGSARDWYAELGLNYNRKFGAHKVSALMLYNQSKKYYPKLYTDIPSGYVGLVGRLTYDYATRYLMDFNIGYNGSENFAPGKRYGIFPALSLGWIVSEEKFMKKQSLISYLKLRGSYGVVGNDQIGDDRFLYLDDSYALEGDGYFFGTTVNASQPGAIEKMIGNSGVTWEKAYKQNYGMDIHFFKDRLKLNFDYFYEHRKDILLTRNNVPAYLGMILPAVNYGIVDNKGYEIAIKWNDRINKSFNYWVDLNLSFARNKIIEQDEVKQNEPYMTRTGLPVGQPFGKIFWGFYDETANERYRAQYGTDIAQHSGGLEYGDCVYVDLNGDGVIDGDDSRAIGYSERPEYSGGLNMGFTWKNFEMSMSWSYAWNVSRMLGETFRRPFGGTNNRAALLYQYENRWTPETASTATYPRASFNSVANNYDNSDLWLKDASYLRLKNVEISYLFDFPCLKNIGINQLRLFVNGYNLLTFDKLKVIDPETKSGQNPCYPLMKVVNIGLKIGF